MVKQVSWNNDAEETFNSIAEYLQDNFSMATATRFADAVYDKIDMLIEQPEIGRPSPIDSFVRILKIDKHRLMFYSFDGSELIIIDFFDTRQNPNKRKY